LSNDRAFAKRTSLGAAEPAGGASDPNRECRRMAAVDNAGTGSRVVVASAVQQAARRGCADR
jgi:hypothetical protein